MCVLDVFDFDDLAIKYEKAKEKDLTIYGWVCCHTMDPLVSSCDADLGASEDCQVYLVYAAIQQN